MAFPPTDELECAVFDTDWGWVGAARSGRGLVSLAWPRPSAEEALVAIREATRAKRQVPNFSGFGKKLRDYFAGKRIVFDEALDFMTATPFQRQVWLATREIPYRETRSYAWVAGRLGKSMAYRAVGQALGKNPLPIIVPCHRVLTSAGTIGGFSEGLGIKRRLLQMEGAFCPKV